MRNLIIGVAALMAVALPSIAMADTGGSIKLTYASIDDDFDNKDNVVGLSGVVITDLSGAPGWRLQANAATADADSYDNSYAYSQGELHAVYDLGQFQVGGFAGMANLNGFGFYEYGVEAAYNFGRGQVAASVAGATSPNADFIDELTTVAVTASFDITDDLSVGAVVSTTDSDDFVDSIDSWGLNIAYEIPSTDFTVAAGYRSSDVDSETVDFFGVSLGWAFGEGGNRGLPGAIALIPDAIAIE